MIKILQNVEMRDMNTFGLSVRAAYYGEFYSYDELRELMAFCSSEGLRWMVLGSGANVIFRGDYDGCIVRSGMCGVEVLEDGLVVADAGLDWDRFVGWCVERGLGGVENLSYIPGSVGASPIQNIGAYGVEVGDVVEWVEYYDVSSGEFLRLGVSECGFGYRESVFKRSLRGAVIVTRVGFRLVSLPTCFNIGYGDVAQRVSELGGATLVNVRRAITEIRKSKLPEPSELGNAGSFFKNPVVSVDVFDDLRDRFSDLKYYESPCGGKKIPAGWMIERAGLKGYRAGCVGVHERQALVLVNYGGATADDILGLSDYVVSVVYGMFGVELEREVNVVEGHQL